MDRQIRLGINSFAYRWNVLDEKMNIASFLSQAESLGVEIAQICDNFNLLELSVDDVAHLCRAVRGKISIQTGFRGHEMKKLEKAMMAERKEQIAKQLESAIAEAEKVVKEVKEKQEGGRVFYTVEGIDSSNASKLMQKIRELDSENSYFIFSVDAAKVAMYALVAKEKASKTFSAKTWISEVAAVCGGKGGGSPMQAQGQSKDPSNVKAAFAKAEEILKANL